MECHQEELPEEQRGTAAAPEDLYYWETNGNAEPSDVLKKAWHWTHWAGAKTYEGMEFSGEVIATFLGLTRSKYQWILDAQEREEEERALLELENKQRRQLQLEKLLEEEKMKLLALEHGGTTTVGADGFI